MNKEQKAEQIVEALFNNYPQLNSMDLETKLEKRRILVNDAKKKLVDKTGESDWNVAEVYKSLEATVKLNGS
ncbi:MAG: hypothetical protein OEX02_13510 [Cyclobacteriaceae bacterium]|nr:hypothetical protein [Cyclobacteriaceae bacterium]